MKAAILARVSSSEQATPDRHSLPGQVTKMQAYASAKGWEVARVFEIPGESAYTDNLLKRPEFAAAIAAAERGEFQHLLIDEASRFARDQFLFHDSMRRLRKAGVQLWAVSMDMELSGNPLLAGIFAAVAEESSRLQGAKIAAAKTSRFRRGLHTADIPFGYDNAGPGEPARVNEGEAVALRAAFHRYLVTGSIAAVAQELNDSGCHPHSKAGKTFFEASSVQSLLRNRFYIGEIEHRGERAIGAHQPIIDENLFLDVQSRMKQGGTRTGPTVQMCTGIIVCRQCQRRMVTQRSDSNWYYRDARTGGVICPNQRRGLRVTAVASDIDAIFGGIDFRDPDFVEFINHRERKAGGSTVASAEREALDAERRRVNQMFQKGWMTEAEYEAAIQEIKQRTAVLPVSLGAVWKAHAQVSSLREAWAQLSDVAKRAALQEVLEMVEADAMEGEIRIVPRTEYAGLFAERRAYVHGVAVVRPAGIGWNAATGRSYSAADLVTGVA